MFGSESDINSIIAVYGDNSTIALNSTDALLTLNDTK